MNEQFSIAGKVAVITGAGGVLGGSIAKCFMQQGAKVVAVDIRQEQLDKRVEELKTYGEDVIGIVGNVLDIASLEKLAASLHRNCTAPFSSLISPKRFIGVLAKTFLLRSVSEPSGLISTARFWSPMKKPGAIAFTRMPSPYFSASSLASH